MQVEKAFLPKRQVQRFKETTPPQVRAGMHSVQHQGVGAFVAELKSRAMERRSKGAPGLGAGSLPDEKKSRRRQQLQEDIVYYENQRDQLHESSDLGDAYSTVFVAHIPTETSDEELRALFSKHGSVTKLTHVKRTVRGKRRAGYAFVVYANRADAKRVVANGNTIGSTRMFSLHGKRLVVDVERGRVVKNWLPLRLRR